MGLMLGALVFWLTYEYYELNDFTNENYLWKPIIFGVFVGVTSSSFTIFYVISLLEVKISRIKRIVLEYEAIFLREEVKNDIFENSIEMSYKYLDQYYLQTREQAQKGFIVTVCVSIVGAILVSAGIIAMFFDVTNSAYVSTAAGIITEFIATIFFYLYNKTVSSMSKYHNKLVLSHNISIALKVAESLPDKDQTSTKENIIQELLKDINSYLIAPEESECKKTL